MKCIPLTQGKYALVDDADFEWLNRWKWCAHRMGRLWYAVRKRRKADGPGPGLILLHREILRPPGSLESDHINGDGLDNRRANLRAVTHSINQANHIHQKRGRDLPMGVFRHGQRFQAQIRIDGHDRYLGLFDTPEGASAAYRTAREERIATADVQTARN